MLKFMVVEDDGDFADELVHELPAHLPEGSQIRRAADLAAAEKLLERFRPDCLCTDMIFPERAGGGLLDEAGVALIDRCRALVPACRIVVLSSRDRDFAVSLLLRRAIDDYLFKDADWEEILLRLGEHGRQALAARRERLVADETRGDETGFLGRAPATAELLARADRVAATDATVLLLGESGTGKEVLARRIHEKSSRRDAPFVALNCGALDEDLVRSELFGHVKGAFTGASEDRAGKFELAHGGTLFLDEVGELSPANQVRLLRVLEERQIERVGESTAIDVDVRLLAATHRDLEADVRDGRFREDLFFRLHVFPLHLPPLRERREDVPLLAARFLVDFARRCGKDVQGFDEDALRALTAHDWPGNVRQLRNAVEYAVILAKGPLPGRASLPPYVSGEGGRAAVEPEGSSAWRPGASYQELMTEQERILLEAAMRACAGDTARCAEELGMPLRTLQSRLKRHGLRAADYRS